MNLAQDLSRACAELGLRIHLGYVVTLASGDRIFTVARIPDLGGPQGMLVLREWSGVEIANQLSDAGYGFSAMTDSDRPEEQFDLQLWKEIFADWTWTGAPEAKPDWM